MRPEPWLNENPPNRTPTLLVVAGKVTVCHIGFGTFMEVSVDFGSDVTIS